MLRRHYNQSVNIRKFKVGDLVLKQIYQNAEIPGEGKLGANWEGPYTIIADTGHGAYRLKDRHGNNVRNP